MDAPSDPGRLLTRLGLTEYEATALGQLLEMGRTTAPDLARATGIPKARIYGVLGELSDAGYVKVFPGRPKEYQPTPPEAILEQAVENERRAFESYRESVESVREEFVETFGALYARATEEVTPAEELFYVVDVGEPSERETRRLYRDADREVRVLTKSFEYLGTVESAVRDAVDRGIDVRVLLLHPERLAEDNREIQAARVDRLATELPSIDLRFSPERLPWRGTVADPSLDYDSGEAIILVEEEDVPLPLREAAVTENPSFVAGIARYFDLVWEHEAVDRSALDG